MEITRRGFVASVSAAAGVAAIAAAGPARAAEKGEGSSSDGSSSQTTAKAAPSWTTLNPQDETYDAYTTDYAAIFSPIQVGPMTLRNRIVKSAAGSDTLPRKATEMSQNVLDYYGRFADGGAALVIVEDGVTSGFGMNPSGKLRLENPDDGIEVCRPLADRVHAGGAYIGTQLGIGSPIDPGDANAYSVDDLHALVEQYGECAARLKAAGFDCVEIKGATTDGLNQFVTRRYNQREDEYGAQTEENRVRFFSEIIASIREACGEDFGILVLINAVEESDEALGDDDRYILIEESQYLAKALVAAGADSVQVRVGTPGKEANCWATDANHCVYQADGTTGFGTQFDYAVNFEGLQDGAHSGVGAFIPMARKIKEVVDVPVGCASYMDPRTAPDLINDAVANGDVDLVYMNRPLTVDPELPNKLQQGRRDEVAPCTRCFHCHGAPYGESEMCRVNPTTQFAYTDEFPEGYDLTPAETPMNVMVVGGGVGGMEAAFTAAQRGHKVTLYEKGSSLGGLLTYARAIKGNHERFTDLEAYMERMLEVSGVQVVTGTEVDLDAVRQAAPDAVVVATGGARQQTLPGAVGMDDIAGTELGSSVVIVGASMQATDLAQFLIAQGTRVSIVSERVAADVDSEQSYWVRTYARAHLYAHGVKAWNEVTLDATDAGSVTFTTANGYQKTIACDTVVDCRDMVADTALVDELVGAGFAAYAVGCDVPRNIQSSIHAGYKVARYL